MSNEELEEVFRENEEVKRKLNEENEKARTGRQLYRIARNGWITLHGTIHRLQREIKKKNS